VKRLALLAALSLSSCASGPAAPLEIPLLEATIEASWLQAERPRVFLHSIVLDSGGELESRTVGSAAVGSLNNYATIVSTVTVEEQVRDAMVRALRAHRVLAPEAEGSAYAMVVLVNQFSVREFVTGGSPEHSRASVAYDVLVRDAAGTLCFAREIEARVVSESSWSDATSLNEPTLRQAMRETLDTLFADASFRALFEPLPTAAEPVVGTEAASQPSDAASEEPPLPL